MEKSPQQIERNVSASFGYVKKDMLMLNDAFSDLHDKVQHLSLNHAMLLEEIGRIRSGLAKKKTNKAPAKKKAKKVVAKKKIKKVKDDLTKIEGVGPAIKRLLWKNKLESFKDLSKAPVKELREILDGAGPMFQMHNPSTWARQAKLASQKKWVELERYQNKLDGGISKKVTKKKKINKKIVKKTIVKNKSSKKSPKKVIETKEIVY
jgi:predicted flap endonuclease-1-like 5' DNA nuclease